MMWPRVETSDSTKNISFFTFRFSEAGFRPIKKRYTLNAVEAKIYDSMCIKCKAFNFTGTSGLDKMQVPYEKDPR
jgi:hypothetical protein